MLWSPESRALSARTCNGPPATGFLTRLSSHDIYDLILVFPRCNNLFAVRQMINNDVVIRLSNLLWFAKLASQDGYRTLRGR